MERLASPTTEFPSSKQLSRSFIYYIWSIFAKFQNGQRETKFPGVSKFKAMTRKIFNRRLLQIQLLVSIFCDNTMSNCIPTKELLMQESMLEM